MKTATTLLLLEAAAVLGAAEPQKHALLIAVSEYNYSAYNRNPLKYPVEDAKAIAKALEPHGYTVDLLLGKQATQAAVRERLKGLNRHGNAAGALVVGVFGHGMEPADSATSYFCPYDAGLRAAKDDNGNVLEREEPDPDTLVSALEVIRAMRLSPAGNRVLLADCCRDDESRARKRSFGKEFTLDMLPNNTAVLLACEPGQTARESGVWRHGAFSKALLEAIKAEEGRAGGGSLLAMADGVAERVAGLVREVEPGGEQTLSPLLKGRAKLLLTRPGPAPGEAKEFRGTPFRFIPAGSFMMGSPDDEPERDKDDEKQVRVTISKGFWLAETEVTQAEWKRVMQTEPSHFKGDKLPVEQVSWYDAVRYCNARSKQEGLSPCYKIGDGERPAVEPLEGGKGYRLPTEAEWEYACRAGTPTPFYTGDNLSTDQGNYDGNYPYNGAAKGEYREKTTEVRRFLANAWNLRDMHGNVSEWCEDEYVKTLAGGTDPVNRQWASRRVYRGGNWIGLAWFCRSANRGNSNTLDVCDKLVGFRPVRSSDRG